MNITKYREARDTWKWNFGPRLQPGETLASATVSVLDSTDADVSTSVVGTVSADSGGVVTLQLVEAIANSYQQPGIYDLLIAGVTSTGRKLDESGALTITGDTVLHNPPVGSITLTPSTPQTLSATGQVQLTATVRDPSGNVVSYPLTWSTSDKTKASVDQNGLVFAVGAGACTITAAIGGITATVAVTVKAPVTVSFTAPPPTDIGLGMTGSFAATASDGSTVSYTSSNPAVATVNASSGVVTPVARGATKITATAGGVNASAALAVHDYALDALGEPGARALWLLDEGSGTIAYNSAGPKATRDNLLSLPERMFSNALSESPWNSNAATDDYALDEFNVLRAARFLAAASANKYWQQVVKALPAGQYTVSARLKSNTGLAQTIRMSGNGGATDSGNLAVPATGWTTLSYTFTQAAVGDAAIIPIWQDAAGDACDLVVAWVKMNAGATPTAYQPPTLDLQFVNGAGNPQTVAPVWVAGGGLNMQGRTLAAANTIGLPVQVQRASVYVVAQWTGTPVLAGTGPLLNADYLADAQHNLYLDAGDSSQADPHSVHARFAFSSANVDAYCIKASDGGWHVFSATYDGATTMTFYIDDVPVKIATVSQQSAVTLRQLFLAEFGASSFWPGAVAMAAFYDVGHSAAQVKAIGTALRGLMAGRGIAMTPLAKLVVWEGDSISDVSAGTGYYPNIAQIASTKGSQGCNAAASGSKMTDVQNRKAYVKSLYDATRAKNVLHLLIGRNDLNTAGFTSADGANYWTNTVKPYVTEMRAYGFTVIVATILPSTVNAGYDSVRDGFNTALKNDAASVDGISDFAANTIMGQDGQASNATYYLDGTHPTVAGHQILAPIAQAAVDAHL